MDIISIVTNVNGRYNGNLIPYFRKIMHAPNAQGPYHNIRHMLHVTWEAYDGGIHMGLNKEEMRMLLILALWHDYGHLCRKVDDQLNIEIAQEGLANNLEDRDKYALKDLLVCLGYTKFTNGKYDDSYQTKGLGIFTLGEDVETVRPNLLIEILRDCDMSQTFSPVWIQSIMYGLSKELEMTPMQMLELQQPFLSNMHFYSKWGNNKFGALIPERIEYVKRMLEVLK